MSLTSLLFQVKCVADFATLCRKVQTVQGWLNDVEGYCLMGLAEGGPGAGAVVEIGSYMGRSTFWLATGTMRSGREKVTAVDHFQGSPEHQADGFLPSPDIVSQGSTLGVFKDNITRLGIGAVVDTLAKPSLEAVQGWSRPIRLLFIDGEHSYEAVRDDFAAWSPFVVPSGIVAFHDCGNPHFPGVKRFCDELLIRPAWRLMAQVRHLLVVQKVA